MDQGKKLCSLDHEIFIDALPCVSLLFRMDFQEIDPYKNPIKSTICIGNASWFRPVSVGLTCGKAAAKGRSICGCVLDTEGRFTSCGGSYEVGPQIQS